MKPLRGTRPDPLEATHTLGPSKLPTPPHRSQRGLSEFARCPRLFSPRGSTKNWGGQEPMGARQIYG